MVRKCLFFQVFLLVGLIFPAWAGTENDLLIRHGSEMALKGQWKLAEPLFEQVAKNDPRDAHAQYWLGRTSEIKGKQEEAIGRYEIALQVEPGFLPARMSLANALLRQGKADLAVPHFQKVLGIRPNDAALHLNLGLCLFQMGRMEEAKLQHILRS